MINELNKELIEKALAKLSKSSVFEKAPRSVRLLKFLISKALNNEYIKEDVIGIELFKSNYNPNQNDSKVRVYMYNLRKRLNEYYADEGATEKIVFEIVKGQYNVSFINREKELNKSIKKKKQRLISTSIISLLVTVIVIFTWIESLRKDNCWDYFFHSQSEIACILSDHLVVQERKNEKYIKFTHIHAINSERDLADYLVQNPDEKLNIPDFTFLTKMAPVVVQDLTKWFTNYKRDFKIFLESEFSIEGMRNYNLLFVGQYETMGNAKELFLKDSRIFTALEDGFILKTDSIQKEYTTNTVGLNRTEFTMVSFTPVGTNNVALFFAANHDLGVMATVNNFTNKKWLKEFYTNFPEDNRYFNALFQVSGIKRTDLDCKLIYIEYLKQ